MLKTKQLNQPTRAPCNAFALFSDMMTFENLHEDTDCNCVEKAVENTQDIFARRVFGLEINDGDFETYWEMGKRPATQKCKEICGYKAVSILRVNGRDEKALISGIETQMARTAGISPRRVGPSIFMTFKCREGAGVIEPSPQHKQLPGSAHHSLFKCDGFTVTRIESITFVQLNWAK